MKKTIVLTGGSKGMGRSTLLKFAENDFNIFTCSRKKTDLKLVEDEIKKVNPNIVFSSIEADLSQKEVAINLLNLLILTLIILMY